MQVDNLNTESMFPENYIEEFSPTNPNRRDSETSCLQWEQEMAKSLDFRHHLKHFKPRRNQKREMYDADVQMGRKLNNAHDAEYGDEGFYVSSSSPSDIQEDSYIAEHQRSSLSCGHRCKNRGSLVNNITASMDRNSSMQSMQASTPRKFRSSPRNMNMMSLDDSLSTIFSPPSPQDVEAAPTAVNYVKKSYRRNKRKDETFTTLMPGSESEDDIDLI